MVDGWDLAYLKFCCKVQGIRNELFANDVCKVRDWVVRERVVRSVIGGW